MRGSGGNWLIWKEHVTRCYSSCRRWCGGFWGGRILQFSHFCEEHKVDYNCLGHNMIQNVLKLDTICDLNASWDRLDGQHKDQETCRATSAVFQTAIIVLLQSE